MTFRTIPFLPTGANGVCSVNTCAFWGYNVGIVEKDQFGMMLFAGIDHVAHDDRELLLPHAGIHRQAQGKPGDFAAGYRFLRFGAIQQVGANNVSVSFTLRGCRLTSLISEVYFRFSSLASSSAICPFAPSIVCI